MIQHIMIASDIESDTIYYTLSGDKDFLLDANGNVYLLNNENIEKIATILI